MHLMEVIIQQILCPKGYNIKTFPSLVFSVYIAMFNGGICASGAKGVLMVTYNYDKNGCLFPTQQSHIFPLMEAFSVLHSLY